MIAREVGRTRVMAPLLSTVLVAWFAAACESPEPPASCGAMPQVTIHAGETSVVSACFNDPNGDMLTYSVSYSNSSVATASISGASITVRAVAPGNASITVTASDPGGLQGQQSFQVAVPNRPPVPRGAIPSMTIPVGRTASVSVSSYFTEPDGQALTYAATSSKSAVATVSVAGSTVTVTAIAKGTNTVTVTATDPGGLTATQTFQAMVPNRSPEAVGTIPDQTVEVSETATLDLSAYFDDPDDDALTYAARSTNTGVARVSVSGSTVTITAVAKGRSAVTVAARDPEGLEATQTFQSIVPNRSPDAVGTIPDQTVEVSETATLDATRYFTDPDGDALTYTARSSNTRVARVLVSGSTITITAVAKGRTTVTIMATDPEGLEATQTFQSMVPNRSPEAVGTIPDQTVEVNETATLDATRYFTDPDGDALTYTARSSNTGVARVSLSGSTVTITAVAAGSATITVTASDPDGLTATQRASVAVTRPNRAPKPVGTIPDREVEAGSAAAVDVGGYFTEPDGDALRYSATSSLPATARVTVSGSVATVTGVAKGSATVTVTARDPEGLSATQTFRVTVPNRAPVAVGAIPPLTLVEGESFTATVSQFFDDPDGDELSYTVSSSRPQVTTTSMSGSTVTVVAEASGTARVTVTATDPGDLSATQTFRATVEDRGSFDIDLVFATEVTSAQERAFRDAAQRWMAILAETELRDFEVDGTVDCGGEYEQTVGTIDDLMIVAAVVEIDGPGGILGQAGPCWVRSESGLPFFGRMEFDEADLEREERQGRLKPLVLHEMGHVLGIGALWRYHDLLRNPSSQSDTLDTHFVGRLAISAFDAAGGDGYTGGDKVPVENTGGPGTRNGHWRRSVFGNELMIGWLGNSPLLSAITIQSLADLGYTVDTSVADAYRLPDAAAVPSMLENSIDLGNDIITGPVVVVDRNGRIVRVIPPN